MPNLIKTRVYPVVVGAPKFDKNMARACQYGALDFFVSQTESGRSFVTPALKEAALASMGKTLEIPVLNANNDMVTSSVRTCTIPANHNTSEMVKVVYLTASTGFQIVPAQYTNQYISIETDVERKLKNSIRVLSVEADKWAIAALAARKTQVFGDSLGYPIVGNSLVVPFVDRNNIIGDLDTIMMANCYNGNIHIVGNGGIDSLIRKQQQLGQANMVNKQLEFLGKQLHYTNNIVNEDGIYATAYAVEDGQVGLLQRAGRENLAKMRVSDTEWDTIYMPELGMYVDVRTKKEEGDASTVGGESTKDLFCTPIEYYSLTIEAAFMVSYNSDPTTIADPIVKFEIESPEGSRGAIPVEITNGSTNPIYTQTV